MSTLLESSRLLLSLFFGVLLEFWVSAAPGAGGFEG